MRLRPSFARFVRRYRMKAMIPIAARITPAATPPTVPPAIAPTFGPLLWGTGAAVADDVEVCTWEVAHVLVLGSITDVDVDVVEVVNEEPPGLKHSSML